MPCKEVNPSYFYVRSFYYCLLFVISSHLSLGHTLTFASLQYCRKASQISEFLNSTGETILLDLSLLSEMLNIIEIDADKDDDNNNDYDDDSSSDLKYLVSILPDVIEKTILITVL